MTMLPLIKDKQKTLLLNIIQPASQGLGKIYSLILYKWDRVDDLHFPYKSLNVMRMRTEVCWWCLFLNTPEIDGGGAGVVFPTVYQFMPTTLTVASVPPPQKTITLQYTAEVHNHRTVYVQAPCLSRFRGNQCSHRTGDVFPFRRETCTIIIFAGNATAPNDTRLSPAAGAPVIWIRRADLETGSGRGEDGVGRVEEEERIQSYSSATERNRISVEEVVNCRPAW